MQATTIHTPTDDMDEPILAASLKRFVLFPLRYPVIWSMYKEAMATIWAAEQIDLSSDNTDWEQKLTIDETAGIAHTVAALAVHNSCIQENLTNLVASNVTIAEARCYFGFQAMTELIHAEYYSRILTVMFPEEEIKSNYIMSVVNSKATARTSTWVFHRIENHAIPFSHRLVAFAALKGILSSSLGVILFLLKSRGLMSGLTFAHTLMSRDNDLHVDFACLLFHHLDHKPTQEVTARIIMEVVTTEKMFIDEHAFILSKTGINLEQMHRYIEFIADRLLACLGSGAYYLSSNPFPFVPSISVETKGYILMERMNCFQRNQDGNATAQDPISLSDNDEF